MSCSITATSAIPLWYGDENGDYPIPATIETCPMSYGMGFSIAVSQDSYNSTIASIHVDSMEYRKVPFAETIDFPGYEGRYEGYVECNGVGGTIHVTLTDYPPLLDRMAQLHIQTAPQGASAKIGTNTIGTTDLTHLHRIVPGTYTEKVTVDLTRNHFKDKSFRKTLRPGLHEYALYRLTPASKIKGKTKKDRTAETATFTFTLFERGRDGTQIYEEGVGLKLLNQLTGITRDLITNATGAAATTIPYEDDFFASGRQKLACIMDNTADRIRTFRTITISKVAGDAIDTDEDWHEEDDDASGTTSGSRSAVDDAYARIGK